VQFILWLEFGSTRSDSREHWSNRKTGSHGHGI
jgi:hypothetical protein